jgi:hypothetical protein
MEREYYVNKDHNNANIKNDYITVVFSDFGRFSVRTHVTADAA